MRNLAHMLVPVILSMLLGIQIPKLCAQTAGRREGVEDMERTLLDRNLSVSGLTELLKLWEGAGGLPDATVHYTAMSEAPDAPVERTVLAHLVLGQIAIGKREPSVAREHYWAALKKVSPAADRWRRSVRRHVLDEVFIARDWLDDAITAYNDQPDISLLLKLGEHLRRQGRGFEMLDLYHDYLLSASSEDEDHFPVPVSGRYAGLATTIMDEIVSLNESEPLKERFDAAVVERPQDPRLYRNLGYLLFKTTRHADGLRALEQYLAVKDKPSAADCEWIGGLCKGASMIEEATRFYERALATEVTREDFARANRASQVMVGMPDIRARMLGVLGSLYMEQERWAEAEACFRKIVDSKARWSQRDAQTKLALIWEKMGKENVLVRDLREKVTGDPCNVQVRATYAGTLLRAGDPCQAVIQYVQAVRSSPTDLSLHLRLGEALEQNREPRKAAAEYKDAFLAACRKHKDEFRRSKGGDETEPGRILYRLIGLYGRLGEKEKVLETYAEVLELLKSPDVRWQPDGSAISSMIREMADIYYAEGQYDRAAKLWLAHRKDTGWHARHAIEERLRHLDSLQAYIEQLQHETAADPNDYWARFILADMLFSENRRDEGMSIYGYLAREAPANSEMHHALGRSLEDLSQYDLAILAYTKELSTLTGQSNDYAPKLAHIAAIHIKLGNKAEGARLYREAIGCDPLNPQYRLGLSAATNGQEGSDYGAKPKTASVQDMAAMRSEAASLLSQGKNLAEAARLFEQILQKAPTDAESMACLAQAYEDLGQKDNALALYEKAYRMRKWSGNNVGADALKRVYHETGQAQKLLALLDEQQDYYGIRDYYESAGQRDQFERYLLDKMEKEPSTAVRWHLGAYYLGTGNLKAAAPVYEALRSDLTDATGKATSTTDALRLASSFERLGRLDEAMALAASVDYEHESDAGDSLGEVLTRLHARTGQFDQALNVCALRIRRDAQGYRTTNIAKQIIELSQNRPDGTRLLHDFLERLSGQIPRRQYDRFRGAVLAYVEVHFPLSSRGLEDANTPDPPTLLRQGHTVQVPQNSRSFADFLERLAVQADTLVVGSFMGGHGEHIDSPHIDLTEGPVWEILAGVLDGRNIPILIDPDGHWEINEVGDKDTTFRYAASGGLLCTLNGFNPQPDLPHMRMFARTLFEPRVNRDVVAIQSIPEVLEAVDGGGQRIRAVQSEARWGPYTDLEVRLDKPDPSVSSITRLRIKTTVALATQWASFKLDRLDHHEPVKLEDHLMSVTVSPLTEPDSSARDHWRIFVDVQGNVKPIAERGVELRKGVYFTTSRGTVSQANCGGTLLYGERSRLILFAKINSFDPPRTSLTMRLPAAVELIPLELTFHDVPIVWK